MFALSLQHTTAERLNKTSANPKVLGRIPKSLIIHTAQLFKNKGVPFLIHVAHVILTYTSMVHHRKRRRRPSVPFVPAIVDAFIIMRKYK